MHWKLGSAFGQFRTCIENKKRMQCFSQFEPCSIFGQFWACMENLAVYLAYFGHVMYTNCKNSYVTFDSLLFFGQLCAPFIADVAFTLSLPKTLLSAKFLAYFYFQSAIMLLKFGENVVWVSNSLDLDETPLGVSSGSKLFAYGTIVVLGGLRVNEYVLKFLVAPFSLTKIECDNHREFKCYLVWQEWQLCKNLPQICINL